jgi:nitrate/nitrite transporter NarK
MTAIPISGVIGGPISGWILGAMSHVGGLRAWQWLYLYEALPSIIAGFVALVFLADNPKGARWLNSEEKQLLVDRLEEDERLRRTAAPGHHNFAAAFLSGRVWLLALVYFGFVMGNYGVGFWLPQIIKETLTKTPWQIGLLSAIPWGVTTVAMVAVGRHSDQTGERRWHIFAAGMIGAVAFAVSGLPGISGIAGLIALTIAASGVLSASSTFWSLPTGILSGAAASAGIAWINSVGNLAGYVSPFVVGRIRDQTHSMTIALLVLSGSSLISALIAVLAFRGREAVEPAALRGSSGVAGRGI